MMRYKSLMYKIFLDTIIKRNLYTTQTRTLMKSHPFDAEPKQGDDNNFACCLPYLPQCPPAIPDCEPCAPCPPCPPSASRRPSPLLHSFLMQTLKALILGAAIYWTYTEGVWNHPKITDKTFRRWYGLVFGSPIPEACICDDKKHIPTHEEISYRVNQTYYSLTAGAFKGMMGVIPKDDKNKSGTCSDHALCPKA